MAPGWGRRRIRGLANRTLLLAGVLLIGLSLLAGVLVRSALASTITVNSTADNQANDGFCTLREAIIAANTNTVSGAAGGECAAGQAAPTVDLISFAIPGGGIKQIVTATDLPVITEPVTINGYSQPLATANTQASLANGSNANFLIEINGANGPATLGLVFNDGSDGSTVQGLAIARYDNAGITVNAGADGINILGNLIGREAPGAVSGGGNSDGIRLAARATVGGPNAADRNIIVGGDDYGIYISDGSGTLIQGNLIGVDMTANASATNGAANIYVGPSATNVTIGNGTLGNVISGGNTNGIEVDAASNVTIRGNRIGTNGAGTAAIGNDVDGILVNSATNVTIGGMGAGEGNLISGNGGVGVDAGGGSGLIIRGNIIGLNLAGTAAISNGGPGILLAVTDGAIVGGSASGARNVISGNDFDGILVLTLSGVTSPVIQGNRIGTSADGSTAIGNAFTGISVNGDGGGTLIGGTGAGEGNLISGNAAPGVDLLDSVGATIQGDIIGLNATQTAALPNGVGGVFVCGCSGPVLIGGTAANAGNVISGNVDDGIYLDSVTGATIQNNRIGTNSAGSGSFGNQRDGIRLEFGAVNNTIGGTAANEQNIIANNAGVGINVVDATSEGNAIRGNAIRANGGLGIDLGDDGVTPNDGADGDAGANDLQNFPVLTNALLVGGSTQVAGSLTSTASSTFAIDVFASPSCDGSGNGEGSVFLGSTSVSTNGAGLATFDQPFAAAPGG